MIDLTTGHKKLGTLHNVEQGKRGIIEPPVA
jgi:hypothetical protein